MAFSDHWQTLDWDDIRLSIYAKTEADVRRALAKPKRSLEDFKALISPAAEPFLEEWHSRRQRSPGGALATR